MASIMVNLRNEVPACIAGMKVESVVDYKDGVNGLPKANVFEYDLEGGNKAIVRPSGTEPRSSCISLLPARMRRRPIRCLMLSRRAAASCFRSQGGKEQKNRGRKRFCTVSAPCFIDNICSRPLP